MGIKAMYKEIMVSVIIYELYIRVSNVLMGEALKGLTINALEMCMV